MPLSLEMREHPGQDWAEEGSYLFLLRLITSDDTGSLTCFKGYDYFGNN